MTQGRIHGDGKTSPFGGGNQMVGHDFIKQPSMNTAPGSGQDFVANPRGRQVAGPPADPLRKAPPGGGASEVPVNPDDKAEGELYPKKDDPSKGVGSVGNPTKPYTLRGGGAAASASDVTEE